MSEPEEGPDLDLDLDGGWPPPCISKGGHSWVVDDSHDGPGEGRTYCEFCGVDGDG